MHSLFYWLRASPGYDKLKGTPSYFLARKVHPDLNAVAHVQLVHQPRQVLELMLLQLHWPISNQVGGVPLISNPVALPAPGRLTEPPEESRRALVYCAEPLAVVIVPAQCTLCCNQSAQPGR